MKIRRVASLYFAVDCQPSGRAASSPFALEYAIFNRCRERKRVTARDHSGSVFVLRQTKVTHQDPSKEEAASAGVENNRKNRTVESVANLIDAL
jgi:hypothetical protein